MAIQGKVKIVGYLVAYIDIINILYMCGGEPNFFLTYFR